MALRVCEQNAAHLCTHVECQPELSIPILGSQLFAPRCSNTLSFIPMVFPIPCTADFIIVKTASSIFSYQPVSLSRINRSFTLLDNEVFLKEVTRSQNLVSHLL